MTRLRARSGRGSRYAPNPAPREIGPCVSDVIIPGAMACSGTLVGAVADDEAVITCTVCGDLWPVTRWLELAELLKARAGVTA